MKKKKMILLLAAAVLLAAALLFFAGRALEMKNAPDPRLTAEEFLNDMTAKSGESRPDMFTNYELYEDYELSYRKAVMRGEAEYIDGGKLQTVLEEQMNAVLARYVEEARRSGDIYNDDKSYKEEVLQRAFDEALSDVIENEENRSAGEITVELTYDGNAWKAERLSSPLDGKDPEETMSALYSQAAAEAEYVEKRYRIDREASSGPAPDQSCFGSTDDAAVIEELLSSDKAQALINGQQTSWNPQRDFIPGRLMRYYLDETILVLQWQEKTALAVGTFSEVFIADGSQLRRKLVNDTAFSGFDYPTELAKQANAVLAVGGDLYNHARACGIVVYNREVYRFEPYTCDTCFITADGSMLYAKAGQFGEQAEVEKYIEENDILFSLCFGPVMIEDSQDVTPESYPWGEINDTYARSSLGMLGERHYLTMNINCEWDGYYYLATLKQATEAMLAHGCVTAYALDGGQTACTVLNGELINVVQFNTEKITSDIIYFATALPGDAAG